MPGVKSIFLIAGVLLVLAAPGGQTFAQANAPGFAFKAMDAGARLLTSDDSTAAIPVTDPRVNMWGIDVLISNGGFGLGPFYRRQFTPDLSGFVSFSISESKDDREVEQIDPFTGLSFVPGKLNRFLVLPLMFGVQYRLFRDDIVDTFRPYVNIGAGPTMIFVSPYVEFDPAPDGSLQPNQIEFFHALGKGQPHYTAAAFIGAGATFGGVNSNVIGVNFRYYFTYLFSSGIPSLYGMSSASSYAIATTKKDFGGFFITVNLGLTN